MKKMNIICLTAITLSLHSCKTIQYIPVETVKTEYRDHFHRDSVYLYDSIHVKEKGDTIYLERYKYLYRDRTVKDSTQKSDTIPIPYPVELPKPQKTKPSYWQNLQIWTAGIILPITLITLFLLLKRRRS